MPASGLARTLRLDGTPLHVPLYVSLVVSPLRCVVRYGNRGLRQVLIREQAEAQRSNGAMHPFAPSNYPAWPAAYDWAVQWVAAMYDDYLWRGETDLIRVRPVLSYACAVLCCAVLCCAVLVWSARCSISLILYRLTRCHLCLCDSSAILASAREVLGQLLSPRECPGPVAHFAGVGRHPGRCTLLWGRLYFRNRDPVDHSTPSLECAHGHQRRQRHCGRGVECDSTANDSCVP